MGIYIFTFSYLCVFSLTEMMRKRIKPKIARSGLFIIAFLILFFIAGFRYGLETDYWTYYREFNGLSTRTLEFSFNLLMRMVKFIYNDYNFFLIVFSVITLGLKYISFRKYKFCFSVLLIYYVRFFVQFDLNAIRQGLAISVVFFALEQLKDDNLKNYIILVVIAATIHNAVLILLVFPLLKKMNLTIAKVVIGLGVAVIFRLYFLDKLILIFRKYIQFVFSSDISVISKLQYILNNDSSNAFALLPYIRIILPTLCLFYLTRETANAFFFKAYYIGGIINIAFFGLDTVGFRLAAYFLVAEILIIGDLYNTVIPVQDGLSTLRRVERKVDVGKLLALLMVIFCDMWTFFALLGSSKTLVPFQTFFGK